MLTDRSISPGMVMSVLSLFLFFFNDTATTEIYTLSLHDALPISCTARRHQATGARLASAPPCRRSEEHTSELQSRQYLVCRLLLEKKKKIKFPYFKKKKKKKKTQQKNKQKKQK